MNPLSVSHKTHFASRSLATLSVLLATFGVADAACDPRVIESSTYFPVASQQRGHTGTVFLYVIVDEHGRAASTAVRRSSGHRRLDRAAAGSVRDRWVFDVSTCTRGDLPAWDLVAVEYRARE